MHLCVCVVLFLRAQANLVPASQTGWGAGPSPVLDGNGWPLYLKPAQLLGKLMMRNVQYHAPSGMSLCSGCVCWCVCACMLVCVCVREGGET